MRSCAAAWDALQLLPNATLKGGRLQVQWQLEPRRISRNALHDFLHPSVERIAPGVDFRSRIFAMQFFHQFGIGVSEINGRYAALRGGHKNLSDRRFCDGVSDLHVLASFSICCRGHAQLGVATLVNAARGAIASFVPCVSDAFPIAEQFLKARQPERCGQTPGTKTRGLAE